MVRPSGSHVDIDPVQHTSRESLLSRQTYCTYVPRRFCNIRHASLLVGQQAACVIVTSIRARPFAKFSMPRTLFHPWKETCLTLALFHKKRPGTHTRLSRLDVSHARRQMSELDDMTRPFFCLNSFRIVDSGDANIERISVDITRELG